MLRRAKECFFLKKKCINSLNEAKNQEVHFTDPVWSNEGPKLVLDPLEVSTYIPRESLGMLFVT